MRRFFCGLSLTLLTLTACAAGGGTADGGAAGGGAAGAPADSPTSDGDTPTQGDQRFPNVVSAQASRDPSGTWTFDVTISSPYDSPARYADAWRVRSPEGTVYGVRELLHDHAAEQPFTRSASGISIPDQVDTVVVEGRDQAHGWGGQTVSVRLVS